MFDASSPKSLKTRTSAGIFCSVLLLTGCGVIGDVLPPALNLPMLATDVTVLEHDKNIVVTFRIPESTTEGMLIRHKPQIDLRIGPAPADPNDLKGWEAHAVRVPTVDPHAETPAGPWVNQKVAISVRLLNDR